MRDVYYLDTCVLIDFLRGRLPGGVDMLRNSSPPLFKLPSIVLAELFVGAAKSTDPARSHAAVTRLVEPFEVVGFGRDEAREYARTRVDLESRGCVIGPNDLIIAATVLAADGILVTSDTGEFGRVRGLHVEQWQDLAI